METNVLKSMMEKTSWRTAESFVLKNDVSEIIEAMALRHRRYLSVEKYPQGFPDAPLGATLSNAKNIFRYEGLLSMQMECDIDMIFLMKCLGSP